MTMMVLTRRLGHEAEWVSTGAAALEAARSSRPEVMLVDLNLPDISGLEIARRLRAELSGTTMIALSGFAEASDRESALEAGFDAFHTKPMDLKLIGEIHSSGRGSVSLPG